MRGLPLRVPFNVSLILSRGTGHTSCFSSFPLICYNLDQNDMTDFSGSLTVNPLGWLYPRLITNLKALNRLLKSPRNAVHLSAFAGYNYIPLRRAAINHYRLLQRPYVEPKNLTRSSDIHHTTIVDHTKSIQFGESDLGTELGFPPLPKFVVLYQILSSLVHLYKAIKTIVILFPHEQYQCLLPGRLSFGIYGSQRELSQLVSLFFSWAHVSWRLIQVFVKTPSMIYTNLFLVQPRQLINDEILRINSLGRHGFCPMDAHARFLWSIMCYRSYGNSLHLRPNRTLASYNRLSKLIGRLSIWSFGLISLFVMGFATPLYLTNASFYDNYDECNFLLTGRSNMPLKFALRFIYSSFDVLENSVFYVDAGLSYYGLAVYLLSQYLDLLDYWRIIQTEMDQQLGYVKRKTEQGIQPKFKDDVSTATGRILLGYRMVKLDSIRLRRLDLCHRMADLIDQIHKADKFSSDLLSAGVSVWLLSLAASSYLSRLEPERGGSIRMNQLARVYQALSFVGFTLVSVVLLALHKSMCITYTSLCSLAAREFSVPLKAELGKIMAEYADSRVPAFTLFHRYPLSPTTYLTVGSWTLSCILITETFWR